MVGRGGGVASSSSSSSKLWVRDPAEKSRGASCRPVKGRSLAIRPKGSPDGCPWFQENPCIKWFDALCL